MSTAEVAEKLVQHCREGKNLDAIEDLYSDDVVSTEAGGETAEGKEAVIAKNQQWYDSVEEMHGVQIGEPIVTGNFFALPSLSVTSRLSIPL